MEKNKPDLYFFKPISIILGSDKPRMILISLKDEATVHLQNSNMQIAGEENANYNSCPVYFSFSGLFVRDHVPKFKLISDNKDTLHQTRAVC